MHGPGRFVGVAAGAVDAAGRILLVRHTYGHPNWELPGGVSEPGETFEADRPLRPPDAVVDISPRTWLL